MKFHILPDESEAPDSKSKSPESTLYLEYLNIYILKHQ